MTVFKTMKLGIAEEEAAEKLDERLDSDWPQTLPSVFIGLLMLQSDGRLSYNAGSSDKRSEASLWKWVNVKRTSMSRKKNVIAIRLS